MFRLFGNWNTYLTADIRKGKHLDQATPIDYQEFFQKSTFKRLSQWTILWVADDDVYWGKANQEKVDQYCFFKTSRSAIETNFAILDAAKKKSLILIINEYIKEHLDQIDGCQFVLETSAYETVKVADDTNFEIRVATTLAVTPTSLNPTTRKDVQKFTLLLHPHNFALINLVAL